MFGYRDADSPLLKELKRQYDRAFYRTRCLEANIARIDYEDFDLIMDELEKAKAEMRKYADAVQKQERIENPSQT